MKTNLLVLLALSTTAAADPQPTDTKLAKLVGRWEGTSSFVLDGESSTLAVTATCQRTAIGPSITCTLVAVAGERRLEEVQLFGYDRASDTYHLFSVNNWGEAYDHGAKWTSADKVAFVHTGTRDGKVLREEYAYTLKANQLVIEAALSIGGAKKASGTTTLKRLP